MDLKQAISLALSLVLAGASALYALAAGINYDDVPATAWYAGAVTYVTEQGLMSGTGGGRFSPDAPMTRAMLAAILYRNEGQPPVVDTGAFSDVKDSWYARAVNWAAANGIVSGYGDGRFGVNDNITREDLAAILWRYAGRPTASPSQDFSDESSIAGYASTAVDWARANGIISGKGNNRFDPKGSATRAEAATIMRNYLTMNTQPESPADISFGNEYIRGFQFDNVLHDQNEGDIHFGMYIPEGYDGTKPYALFVTLPGYGVRSW